MKVTIKNNVITLNGTQFERLSTEERNCRYKRLMPNNRSAYLIDSDLTSKLEELYFEFMFGKDFMKSSTKGKLVKY